MIDLTGNTLPSYITEESLRSFIRAAFAEDIGEGDHSSLASIPSNHQASAKLLIKDNGYLAGVQLALEIFNFLDPTLRVELLKEEGQAVSRGEIGLIVRGNARSILSCERIVLNCMQRMSGIATYTHRLTSLIEGTGVKLKDTRKTTPNFRLAEKWAVYIGGGANHRYALYDMIMLKDNHVDIAGGVRQALLATKDYLTRTGKALKVELETRNLEEVRQAVETGFVDIIMLDNMSPELMKEAVKLIDGRCQTEASGGITETTIRTVAETGVDFISVGALTHSVRSLDISLKIAR